jgi:hypothetical protein
MTFSIMTFRIMKYIITLSITTFSVIILSIMKLGINDIQNDNGLSSSIHCYALCHYAECYYAKCLGAKLYSLSIFPNFFQRKDMTGQVIFFRLKIRKNGLQFKNIFKIFLKCKVSYYESDDDGATTLSITALSILTLRITKKCKTQHNITAFTRLPYAALDT